MQKITSDEISSQRGTEEFKGLKKGYPARLGFGESFASSSVGESHPHALPEPDVNLSAHPAPIDQLKVEHQIASEQKYLVSFGQYALTSDMFFADGHATFCISSSPILLWHD